MKINHWSGVDLGAKYSWLRHFQYFVPMGWYRQEWPLRSFLWFATHGAQWGWEIAQDYESGVYPGRQE